MAVGHSDDVDAADAISAVIEQCRERLDGARPQAGILFCPVELFDQSLVKAVHEAFPGTHVMGSTSAAQISSLDGYQEDSIVLALFVSDTLEITAGVGGDLEQDVESGSAAAVAQALQGTTQEPRLCVLVTEGNAVDPQLTINAVSRALPEGTVLVGGTSARGDFTTMVPTFQFCDDRIVQNGVAILLFSGPLYFSIAVGTGFRRLGPEGVVTRSESGAISEVDGRPAGDFLSPYLSATGKAAFGNPLAIVEAGAEEPYLRATQGADAKSGSITLTGHVPTGARLQITTADTDEILAGTDDALERAMATFPTGAQPEAALIFSCAVRKFLLGSRTYLEGERARAVLGSALPIAGMYCYGEVAPIKGAPHSRYLNETFITLLLGT